MTDRDYYVSWLTDWFSRRRTLPKNAVECDFFKEAWLDSLSTLELIVEIEEALKIPLGDTAFADPRLSTIAGLAEMLAETRAGAGPLVP